MKTGPLLNNIFSIGYLSLVTFSSTFCFPNWELAAQEYTADQAEEPATIDPHTDALYAELLAVRNGLVAAYKARDWDKLASYCHPNILITWQNGEVTRGRDELLAFNKKMMQGKNRIVNDLTANPTVDDRAILYGDRVAVSRGQMNDHYKLRDGTEFDLNSRWSATLVKENNTWQVVAFHASTNAFDNDIIRMAVKKTLIWSAGIAGLGGLILGFLFQKLRRKHVGN